MAEKEFSFGRSHPLADCHPGYLRKMSFGPDASLVLVLKEPGKVFKEATRQYKYLFGKPLKERNIHQESAPKFFFSEFGFPYQDGDCRNPN